MFQFGLFSTFIPYLIIGISYIGFLGMNALENDKGYDFTNITTQYELKNQNLEISADYHYYTVEAKLSEINFNNANQIRNILFSRKFFDDDIIKNYYFHYLFSRPPPSNS